MRKKKKFAAPGILSEETSREGLFGAAQRMGCEKEVRTIVYKYEQAIARCTNPEERKHMAIVGLAEIHQFMGFTGPLVVNGKEILPARQDPTSLDNLVKI